MTRIAMPTLRPTLPGSTVDTMIRVNPGKRGGKCKPVDMIAIDAMGAQPGAVVRFPAQVFRDSLGKDAGFRGA